MHKITVKLNNFSVANTNFDCSGHPETMFFTVLAAATAVVLGTAFVITAAVAKYFPEGFIVATAAGHEIPAVVGNGASYSQGGNQKH